VVTPVLGVGGVGVGGGGAVQAVRIHRVQTDIELRRRRGARARAAKLAALPRFRRRRGEEDGRQPRNPGGEEEI
jgi:hypothetical protein